MTGNWGNWKIGREFERLEMNIRNRYMGSDFSQLTLPIANLLTIYREEDIASGIRKNQNPPRVFTVLVVGGFNILKALEYQNMEPGKLD